MKPLFAMEPLYHFPRAPAALKVHSIWKKGGLLGGGKVLDNVALYSIS